MSRPIPVLASLSQMPGKYTRSWEGTDASEEARSGRRGDRGPCNPGRSFDRKADTLAAHRRGGPDRRRRLHLRLPPRHLRHGPQATDERGRAGCRACSHGATDQDAELPGGGQPLLRRSQRGHPLHHRLARRLRRALGLRHSRDGRALLHHADAGWLLRGVRGRQLEHDGRPAAEVRHHRSGLVGHPAGGYDAGRLPDRDGVDPRAHLLHGHARGLRSGARAARPVLGRSSRLLWQALHATAGRRRPRIRYEDGGTPAGQRPRRLRLLRHPREPAERQPAEAARR